VNGTDLFMSMFTKEVSGGVRKHDFPALRVYLRLYVLTCLRLYRITTLLSKLISYDMYSNTHN
jgi:hypothetical protein